MNRSWQGVRRVLCVRLDNLGDVLMTTPAIRALRHGLARDGRVPHVTLLASGAGSEVARYVPEIDATLTWDAPWVAGGDRPVRWDIATRMAAYRFDAAVIFSCYSQSALPAAMLCSQAEIPLRLAHCRENPYQLLTDWVRDSEPGTGIRHEVERQIALVAAVGAECADQKLSLQVVPEAQERFAVLARRHGVAEDQPYVVLHPGATAPSRRWSAERFGAVAALLGERFRMPVLVTGSRHERELVRTVVATAAHARVHDTAGLFELDELIAAIDGASLLVSNNSGPVHVAAARGTPTVDLYALTNPQHTPWQVSHRVLSHPVPCANCQRSVCPEGHHACLSGVTVDDVFDAASDLLACEAAASVARAAHDAPSGATDARRPEAPVC